MRQARGSLTLLLAVGFGTPSWADTIDDAIVQKMAEEHLPAVCVVVGRRGEIVKKAAYGEASVELHVPATLETVYPIASATKPFTSTAIMMLVETGKFALDDQVTNLLPDLPNGWSDVRVRHLLTHTSGLPDIAVKPGREPLIAATRGEALAKVATMPRQFEAGAKWSYNQTNYMLLLMLVERYTGQPFEVFIRDTFFTPLAMKATVFGDSDDVIAGRATMYEFRDGVLHPVQSRFPEFVRGAAGVNSSVLEWYRWADAWAHGRFLSKERLDLLWRPAMLASGDIVHLGETMSYACGLLVEAVEGHRSVGHSGGGTAAFRYYLDADMLIVVETNGKTNPDKFVERIADAASRSNSR